jgi:2-dehydropantoate 2-reductase
MRCLIWGAGAIGGTLGAYLARSGHDVTMVDTVVEHVEAIDRGGLRITGPIDEFTARVPAFTPATLTGTWETIVLATKAHHTGAAVRTLAPHLAAGGCVVSAQNGLNELVIAEAVGAERTMGAFVNFGADYLEPGVIHYGGRGAVVVGEIDGRSTPRVTAVRDAWSDFDSAAIVTPNVWGYLWGKEAYGAMLFATALTNESIADALAMREHQPLHRWRARSSPSRGLAASVPSRSTASTRRPIFRLRRPARRSARSTRSSRTIAARPSRTAASGAISPCASVPRKWTPSSASS